MPAIREYTNPIDQIRPNNSGMGAIADLAGAQGRTGYYIAQQIKDTGRDFGSAISDAGKMAAEYYDQHRTKLEISQGNTPLTNKEMEYTKRWKERTAGADPNDATIGPKFMEEITADLEKAVNGATSYGGREWMKKQAENMMLGWFKQTNADTATRSGQAIKDNMVKSLNTAGTVVSLNPTALDRMLEMQTDAFRKQIAADPNLTGATRAQLSGEGMRNYRAELVQRGIQTMMDADPKAGLAVLKSGKYAEEISPDGYKALEAYSATAEKRIELEGKARVAQQKEARAQAFQDGAQKVYDTHVKTTPTGQILIGPGFFQDAQKLVNVDPSKQAEVRAMIRFARQEQTRAEKGEAAVVNDPETVATFRDSIARFPGDPKALKETDVYNARAQGLIDEKTFIFYRSAAQMGAKDPGKAAEYRQFKEAADRFKDAVAGRGGLLGRTGDDGQGMIRFNTFFQDKLNEFYETRRVKPNVSVRELLSEGPNSVFRGWEMYRRSTKEQMDSIRDRLRDTGRGGGHRLYNENEFTPLDAQAPAAPSMSVDEFFKKRNGGK